MVAATRGPRKTVEVSGNNGRRSRLPKEITRCRLMSETNAAHKAFRMSPVRLLPGACLSAQPGRCAGRNRQPVGRLMLPKSRQRAGQ